MKLPKGLTEAKALAAIENAVGILANTFTFGIYDREDIEQEARIFGLEALKRWDGLRPLENFLYTHIRNRLINLKRDKYRRNDPPCLVCHQSGGTRSAHKNGQWCRDFLEWKKRNDAKASLMRPLDIGDHEESIGHSSEVVSATELNELKERIDLAIPAELRSSYLRMLAGRPVPRAAKEAIAEAVKEILHEDEK